jgi:invasion protein IalB
VRLRACESAVPSHLQGSVDSLPARAKEEQQEEAALAISQSQWAVGCRKNTRKKGFFVQSHQNDAVLSFFFLI